MKVDLTKEELGRLAAAAIFDIATIGDNFEVSSLDEGDGWTAEGLLESKKEHMALFDRAIELTRAYERAEDPDA